MVLPAGIWRRTASTGVTAVLASVATAAVVSGSGSGGGLGSTQLAALVRAEGAASVAAPATGNAAYFLAADGVTGSATQRVFANQIVLDSWSFEASQPFDSATGQPTGRSTFGPLKDSAESSTATPQLMNDFDTNKVIKTVKLSEVKTDRTGARVVFLTLLLTDVRITKLNVGGTDKGRALDSYEFNYAKIQLTVGKFTASFDVRGNRTT